MLRPFLFNPSLLTIRRAHGEAARRHHHHLGALSAFLEAVLRLQHPFLGRGQPRGRLLVGGDNHFEFDDVSGVIDRVWQDVSILVAGVADDGRYPDQGTALHRAQDSRQHECNRRSKTHGRFLQLHHRKPYTIRQVLAGFNRPRCRRTQRAVRGPEALLVHTLHQLQSARPGCGEGGRFLQHIPAGRSVNPLRTSRSRRPNTGESTLTTTVLHPATSARRLAICWTARPQDRQSD